MTTTLTRPIPIFLALMAAVAAAIAIAVHRHAAAEITPTPAQQALAAPLVTPIPAPGESTQRQIDRYTAALAGAPRDPSAYDNLAFAELQMAREDGDPIWYTKADRLLHHALALSPRDFSALDGMGSLALSRHDFAGALLLGRRALELQPQSSYALGVMVDANVELGRYPAARAALQRMLDAHPDLASYSRASYLLELEGRIGAARHALAAAVAAGGSARENTAWTQVQLGNLDFNHGRYPPAARNYAAALHTYPHFVHALAAQAKLDAALGRHAAAIRLYTTVLRRYPLPAYVIGLGDVYRASGQAAAARREYSLVRAEERLYIANGVNVGVELALFEADHGGNPARALAMTRAVARVQQSVTVEDALGWTLYRAGHLHAALAAANRALALGTKDASFRFHRGAIEAALGLRGRARSDLRAALAINPRFSLLNVPVAHRLLAELGS
jgi:tetratricopeptide (TPR) repeat protein